MIQSAKNEQTGQGPSRELSARHKEIEDKLIKQFGAGYSDIAKGFYRYKDGTIRLGGSLSTFLQNRVRKRYQKEIPNLRLLTSKEGIHIPTGNYIGPGTNLQDADKYGPVEHKTYGPVDKIAQIHDHNYNAVEESKDSMTKDERRDAIFDADRMMLEQLEALPVDVKDSKTWKLAKSGIALKNFAEKSLNRNLYGGMTDQRSSREIPSRHFVGSSLGRMPDLGAKLGEPIRQGGCSCMTGQGPSGGSLIQPFGGMANFNLDGYMRGLVQSVVENNLDVDGLKRLYEVSTSVVKDKKTDGKDVIDNVRFALSKWASLQKFTIAHRKKQKLDERYKFTIYLKERTEKFKDYVLKGQAFGVKYDNTREVLWYPLSSFHYRRSGDEVIYHVGLIPILYNLNASANAVAVKGDTPADLLTRSGVIKFLEGNESRSLKRATVISYIVNSALDEFKDWENVAAEDLKNYIDDELAELGMEPTSVTGDFKQAVYNRVAEVLLEDEFYDPDDELKALEGISDPTNVPSDDNSSSSNSNSNVDDSLVNNVLNGLFPVVPTGKNRVLTLKNAIGQKTATFGPSGFAFMDLNKFGKAYPFKGKLYFDALFKERFKRDKKTPDMDGKYGRITYGRLKEYDRLYPTIVQGQISPPVEGTTESSSGGSSIRPNVDKKGWMIPYASGFYIDGDSVFRLADVMLRFSKNTSMDFVKTSFNITPDATDFVGGANVNNITGVYSELKLITGGGEFSLDKTLEEVGEVNVMVEKLDRKMENTTRKDAVPLLRIINE